MFLRGLMAHASQDEAKAIENWSRLDPARLPARLAAPLRARIDPAYRAAMPSDAAAVYARQQEAASGNAVLDGLRAIRAEFGQDKPLTAAFRLAAKTVPELKKSAPHLVPRLADCFYQSILTHGQPEDLGRYRNLFGPPQDDPKFDRLQAQVNEQIGTRKQAQQHWERYEQWLEAGPPGWPADVAARARAIVWQRMAENAARHEGQPARDDGPLGLFLPRERGKPAPLQPDPETCLRRAAELAPDWPDPAFALVERYAGKKKHAEAEAAARSFLARESGDLRMLSLLAGLLDRRGQFAESTQVWLQALAIQPLDRLLRFQTALAVLNEGRRQLASGKPEDLRRRSSTATGPRSSPRPRATFSPSKRSSR